MVSTRSKKGNGASTNESADAGGKRAAPAPSRGNGAKKQKTEDGKLEVGKGGEVGLKQEKQEDEGGEEEYSKEDVKPGEDMDKTREEMKAEEGEKAEKGEDEVDQKALQGTKGELEEPKHGKSSSIRADPSNVSRKAARV